MRFILSAISALAVAGVSFAEKKSPEQRFKEFHTLSRSSPALKLNDVSYNSLTANPRDYTVAVLLTAQDARFGCQLCREFQPEWDLVAKSWFKGDRAGESRLLFGTLDFAEGRDVFVSVRKFHVLNCMPCTNHFCSLAFRLLRCCYCSLRPTVLMPYRLKSHCDTTLQAGRCICQIDGPVKYLTSSRAAAAEQVQAWLARQLPGRPHPAVKRPINWLRWASSIVILLGFGTVMVTASPYVLPIIQNRNIWASISLVSILLFTSGHMFNHIRKVPYVAGDGKGGISYFAGGFQTQFGLETQIIAALCKFFLCS